MTDRVYVAMTTAQATFARHAISAALSHRPCLFDDEQRAALVALSNDIADAFEIREERRPA